MLAAAAILAPPSAAQQLQADTAVARRFWVRPVASLLVPGTGQLLARQDRGAVYVAAELYLLLRFVQLRRAGNRHGEAFRRLAYEAARRSFTDVRRDTIFEYYEQMQRFTESGEFDRDPGPGLDPEGDPTTYNGSVWLLARRTYWANPNVPPEPTSLEYQQALEFYRRHAVGPNFRWSWSGAPLEQQVFRETIGESDGAFRRARTQLGLLLANHLLSGVDALISRRLAHATGRPAAFRSRFAPGRAEFTLRVAF